MNPFFTPPLFTHWLCWADSEVAHITRLPGALGGWALQLSAASVGRSPVPVAAPPTGLAGRDVVWGSATGVQVSAQAGTHAPLDAHALDGCLGRIAHGRWVAADGVPRAWWPLVWPDSGHGPNVNGGPGVLELTFSNGSALRWPCARLKVRLLPGARFHESMAC
jgi:hypothetical protein